MRDKAESGSNRRPKTTFSGGLLELREVHTYCAKIALSAGNVVTVASGKVTCGSS